MVPDFLSRGVGFDAWRSAFFVQMGQAVTCLGPSRSENTVGIAREEKPASTIFGATERLQLFPKEYIWKTDCVRMGSPVQRVKDNQKLPLLLLARDLSAAFW